MISIFLLAAHRSQLKPLSTSFPSARPPANLAEILNVNRRKHFLKSVLLSLLLCPLSSLFAQGTFSVVSTNDGSGQFSWIFSASGGSFPEVDQFKMKLYGVQDASGPAGWAATIGTDEFVAWNYVGSAGAPFTGSPMMFSIHSAFTQSTLYGGIGNVTYPDGLYSGAVFGRFMYEGPQQIPEPSAPFFLVIGTVVYMCRGSFFPRRHLDNSPSTRASGE